MDNESVRVAVALHLGLGVCDAHSCTFREDVDAWSQQTFVCKHALGRSQQHQALNEVTAMSFAPAAFWSVRNRSESIMTESKVAGW